MKKFLVFFVFLSIINFSARADDRVCHVIDSAINMSFSTKAGDDFFNCFQLESFGPTDNLKIVSSSFGMKSEVNVYNRSGMRIEQMQTGLERYNAKEFSNFTSSDKKIIDIRPDSDGIEEVEVKISYLIEKNGKHIFIISTQLAEESGGQTTPKPPVCAPGDICSNPLSTPVTLFSMASNTFQCNETNTPPSNEEMGLKDQGINQYAEMMFELGQQSDGLFETMSLIYYHYTDSAQNPKSLPGGTEHGGNFRYGVGVAAALDGSGVGKLAADYITYGGSAFQDALQNYTEVAQDAPFYNELDWYYQIGILNNSVGKAILLDENSTDQQSISEGIAFFREVYKSDSNRGNVKNSCSQEPKDSNPNQTVSGVSRPGYFFMPTISGGSIQGSIMYGSICDPSDDCFRDLPDDKDQE